MLYLYNRTCQWCDEPRSQKRSIRKLNMIPCPSNWGGSTNQPSSRFMATRLIKTSAAAPLKCGSAMKSQSTSSPTSSSSLNSNTLLYHSIQTSSLPLSTTDISTGSSESRSQEMTSVYPTPHPVKTSIHPSWLILVSAGSSSLDAG